VPSAASRPERRCPLLQRCLFKSQSVAIELPVQHAETERVLAGRLRPDTDVPHGAARHHGVVVIAERPCIFFMRRLIRRAFLPIAGLAASAA
jgi:hypothetical protein